MTDHEQMILGALRYALPRRSYIMSTTEEYIEKMLEKGVSENFVRVCIQDIEDHYAYYERMEKARDSLMYDWKPLLDKLKRYESRRNTKPPQSPQRPKNLSAPTKHNVTVRR